MNTYYPIIKTTISELRAFNNIDSFKDKSITPIFELTKSRKSKNNQGGDVSKRIDDIANIVEGKAFILDLTSEQSLSNDQIESMFDEDEDFLNWRNFVLSLRNSGHNVIPVIQAYDDSSEDELLNQMAFFDEHCESFALRIKSELFQLDVVSTLLELASNFKYTLIIDFSYINGVNEGEVDKGIYFINRLSGFDFMPDRIVICSSSFPPMVEHNNLHSGEFDNYEFSFFNSFKKSYPTDYNIFYGDYASVHPVRNDITAYNWVPRIDYPINHKTLFYRYQRDIGGYKKCAEELNSNVIFTNSPIDCWGYQECVQAKKSPNGKSPSYWISVRINIHIHRVLKWLSS
ncbi:hypothetical protein [Pseudoalteromonas sp. S1727]|uniref:beta family protein n=1 Tax=Pseudoalteromonas sp. S1727 TaxID=2066514 RepID=UPI0014869835|nr:hypothetical protein [Pseudoalteromonas sp. S1727]